MPANFMKKLIPFILIFILIGCKEEPPPRELSPYPQVTCSIEYGCEVMQIPPGVVIGDMITTKQGIYMTNDAILDIAEKNAATITK